MPVTAWYHDFQSDRFRRLSLREIRLGKQHAASRKLLIAVAVAQQALMPQTREGRQQHLEQKTADELARIEGHQSDTIPLAIVFPAESNSSVLKCDQTMVGDSHSMGIAAEVIEHLGRGRRRAAWSRRPSLFCGHAEGNQRRPGDPSGGFSKE